MSPSTLLEIKGLRIAFGRVGHSAVAVNNVSLDLGVGEVVGLVGESGSGKSLTCRSVIRMMPTSGVMSAEEVTFDGRDIMSLSRSELREHRAHNVGMIFQDPFSCLDPTKRVGEQIAETLRVNAGLASGAAHERTLELLRSVNIDKPEQRYLAYPHELSGGMRQRVMIAIAVSAKPKLLVADEPTTALDVTTQAQILNLIRQLRTDTGMSVLLVSHDFGVIAQVCDRVAVMYGGYVVEFGPVRDVCTRPQHPYTRALLDSIPSMESAGNRVRRVGILGQPPSLGEVVEGCPFAERCSFATTACRSIEMTRRVVGEGHTSACPFVGEDLVAGAGPLGGGSTEVGGS
jgi:oligopeptide/dipeptide ABC transporter ATP-binding protein